MTFKCWNSCRLIVKTKYDDFIEISQRRMQSRIKFNISYYILYNIYMYCIICQTLRRYARATTSVRFAVTLRQTRVAPKLTA